MGITDPLAEAITAHGHFEAGALIGKGSYGSVYEGYVCPGSRWC